MTNETSLLLQALAGMEKERNDLRASVHRYSQSDLKLTMENARLRGKLNLIKYNIRAVGFAKKSILGALDGI